MTRAECNVKYGTIEYAANRLNGTIIRDEKGSAIIVKNIDLDYDGGLSLNSNRLRTGRPVSVPMAKADLSPVPLGFCNSVNGVLYLTRIPKRNDWRQGLRRNNYTSVWGMDARNISDRDLCKTIEGSYPSYEFCRDFTDNQDGVMAFNRHFAIQDGSKILYKWEGVVGDIVNNRTQLYKEFEYLNEALEAVVNG